MNIIPHKTKDKPDNTALEEDTKKKKSDAYEIQDIETYHDAFMKYE